MKGIPILLPTWLIFPDPVTITCVHSNHVYVLHIMCMYSNRPFALYINYVYCVLLKRYKIVKGQGIIIIKYMFYIVS